MLGANERSRSDVWAIGVIAYFLLCGYTPFDGDSNLEEMQAILVADYSFTPLEYWRHVSMPARQFIQRCLTIDQGARMTSHQALAHPWITGEGADGEGAADGGKGGEKVDLLPTVKKNFNARRTLHAAIDTIRAINQLRAGGAAAMGVGPQPDAQKARADAAPPNAAAKAAQASQGQNGPTKPAAEGDGDAMEGVEQTGAGIPNHDMMPSKENVNQGMGQLEMDPRGHGRGQTEEMIREQQRRVHETSRGLWERATNRS